jgi:hypothetical protein
MGDATPERPLMRWAAVWTRADALRVGDWVLVRAEEKDLWAAVTSIEPTAQPDRLCLHLVPDQDGAALRGHTHVTPTDTAFLGRLSGELTDAQGRPL